MSISEKLKTIADNEQKVFDAGRDAERYELLGSKTDWSYFCYKGNNLDVLNKLNYKDTSNGTCFNNMFREIADDVEIPEFDTSNAIELNALFYKSENLTSVPNINTSKAQDLSSIYHTCKKLTQVPAIDISNNTNYYAMFSYCDKLTSVTLKGKPKNKASRIESMFNGCRSLQEINFVDGIMDTSDVTTILQMFMNCYSLLEIPAFDTSSVTNFQNAFAYAKSITTIPHFNTSKGTNFNAMFAFCYNLTYIPPLDTSNGKDFSLMFSGYQTPMAVKTIEQINITNATNINSMFLKCVNLENITFDGSINITGLSLQDSTKLTVDSLLSILNALADKSSDTSGKTWKVIIGPTNIAKLSDTEKLIATDKGWTLN